MKRITALLALVLVLATACQKSTSGPSVETTKKAGTVGGEVLAPPPGTIGGGGVTTYTNDQLYAMGVEVGCNLARANNMAPLVYNTNSIYTVYYNTTNNATFNEYYKDGVRYGWMDCFSKGPYVNQCDRTFTVYNSNGTYSTVNICSWLGLPGSGPIQ